MQNGVTVCINGWCPVNYGNRMRVCWADMDVMSIASLLQFVYLAFFVNTIEVNDSDDDGFL